MSRTLVAYFSATGTTKYYAEKIANYLDADLFEIEPLQPYTKADLDWTNSKSRTSIEMNDPYCRPEIALKINNFFDYDNIFVGFPIWWYKEPSIIDTFLEVYFFDGKTIIPFATSGSNGLGRVEDNMKKLVSSDVKFKNGKLVNVLTDNSLRDWVLNLNI